MPDLCPCGKVPYPSRRDAIKHAKQVTKQRTKQTSTPLAPYRCTEGAWHIGHLPHIHNRTGRLNARA